MFRDVHVGHDLDTADDTEPQGGWRTHGVVQHSVDAEPDPKTLLGRLDVDIGRPLVNGPSEQLIDEGDDRLLIPGDDPLARIAPVRDVSL